MRHFPVLLAMLLLPIALLAGEKMEVEIFPLDEADFEASAEIAKGLVSKEGKLVADKENNRLIVYDYASKRDDLRQVLLKIRAPAENVRIQITFKDRTSTERESVQITGRGRAGDVTIGTPGTTINGVNIGADQMSTVRTSNASQSLLVASGRKGRIQIVSELPYADWFWSYGVGMGLWTSGSVKWKQVGAQMVIEPHVFGKRIRVKLTPEFSYLLDGRTLATEIEKLSTEVVVADGQEIDLGGLPAADKEFYSRFLVGFDHNSEKRTLHITLKPTIESPLVQE